MLWKKLSNGQLAANRENAKKSTGPTSAAGKEKVSQNRTLHGLTGRFQVLPNEKQERFEELFNQFMLDENPVGSVEIELVRKMAEHTWCARRASCLLEACFLVIAQSPEQLANNEAEMRVRPELERYERYQAHHDRAYARASAELIKRRNERRKDEIGFESQKRAEAQEKRRDAKENRQVEQHKVAFASAQKTLELKEMRLFNEAAATAKRMNGFEAPLKEEIAA